MEAEGIFMLVTEQLVSETFDQVDTAENPLVWAMPELDSDELVRRRAARFIGEVALSRGAEIESHQPTYTLMDAIRAAADGDADARAMVETNVRTDVVERTIKSGHIMEVELAVDPDGNIVQYGQTAAAIQANSLRYAADHPAMRRRTEAEVRNQFRIDHAYRSGWLEDYAFVVVSRAADDMSDIDMTDAGFFADTMSAALQVTTVKRGRLTVESAFVAGKSSQSADRHDAEIIAKLGQALGVDLDKSATEVIDTPLLVHKSLMPDGVVDLVKLYDECAGGTFFGEARPRQDYAAYRRRCAEREADLKPIAAAISRKLIAEAAGLISPSAASQRLSQLSQHHMVERSLVDTSIDPRVFGQAAAARIYHARHYLEIGQIDKAQRVVEQAQSVARSSSCPGGVSGSGSGGAAAGGETGSTSSASEKQDDCEFTSKKCPVCGAKNAKTRVRKGKYYHVGAKCVA